ncbi:hypothetical protein TBLA_0C04850 [Henningerozyma blattae CBS 6284]|uniref:Cyclin-like domain-containing protein n=1 Tax=Henningerozyma blattae (strain ATCC 34711 / CBS 6284 / DSM 70876 / NBRC 10599 / NRRL Y-10934 / UCD 77-7) TaxID=1071380 RepID=I2H1M9_HENB6|nr:hypothetical protein TBLA_0C04850 [Tetrapisispora blattae CBS 6284]CCH60281.1 hypothetical protein TBLA_0C04850 [Tetrapisispora blattae CBS 6284]
MISDYDALLKFKRKAVTGEMIQFLSNCAASAIQIRPTSDSNLTNESISNIPPLYTFIKNLVAHSNVQTPTLMTTVVYLKKLKAIIPSNVYGIETTRHRMFLGCLIIAAKTLNDSSPLNKHWAKYTNGLLQLREVNTIEREILTYFKWDLQITVNDLLTCLAPFIKQVKDDEKRQKNQNFLLFNSPTPGQLRECINSKFSLSSNANISPYSKSHSRSSSSISIPSVVSSITTPKSSIFDSPTKIRRPISENSLAGDVSYPESIAELSETQESSQNKYITTLKNRTQPQNNQRSCNGQLPPSPNDIYTNTASKLNSNPYQQHFNNASIGNSSIQVKISTLSENNSNSILVHHDIKKAHNKKSSWHSFFKY